MPRTNATLTATGFGTAYLYVTELGHGMNIISSEGEAARTRSFYPWIRTSGLWYVETIWPNRYWFMAFQLWISDYISRISNASFVSPPPMTLSVPSRGFIKIGFPEAPVSYGDSFGMAAYRARLEFSSASDPMAPLQSSHYHRATHSSVANLFYPGGYQSDDAVDPVTTPFYGVPNDDAPSGGGGGGGHMTVR